MQPTKRWKQIAANITFAIIMLTVGLVLLQLLPPKSETIAPFVPIKAIILFGLLVFMTLFLIYVAFESIYSAKAKPSKASLRITLVPVISSFCLVTFLFAVAYFYMGTYYEGCFKTPISSFSEALYYSLTTMTVGPSGLDPTDNLTRWLAMFEVCIGYVYMISVFSVVVAKLTDEQRN